MATYDLEEQEQLDEIKTWWKQHGNTVVGVVLAASLAVAGWQGWNWYQRNQSAQASAILSVLQRAVEAGDTQRVKAAAGELAEKFSSTPAAGLGALIAAKAAVDTGDLKTAHAQLAWVATNGHDEVRELARLRLATLLIDEKAFDEALRTLDGPVLEGFATRFAEVRGDVLMAQGKKAEAATAWRSALTSLDATDSGAKGRSTLQEQEANAPYRELLRLKLESTGEAVPAPVAAAPAKEAAR
ncbi:tetratricopeptide repeat protein [Rhodocyclus tenuis]|uniref:Tetratricopeptide repeat protein n=2 Tax=Rhodocyclus TaxID=1064 RepID=A0A6L5JVI7_RHOTE|nr:tetratricopeptide repeat protein [Rhodocyclus gracilis]MQY51249.1 tetratricopeptide repeat protein [Rhodocyclus gracilis]MRD73792.1 tetratricopeptide repeat protein [Rhodocyclus gracilis]NJA89932.1 tetratricopeptide repeat protein [Rhodocyclus gracilis]